MLTLLLSSSIHSFALFAVAILMGLAIHILRYRKEPGALWQAALQTCKGLSLFCLLLSSCTLILPHRIAFLYVNHAFSAVLTYAWFRFVAAISGYDKRMPGWLMRAIKYYICIAIALVLTNHLHQWIWSSFSMEAMDFHARESGFGYILHLIFYSIGALTIGLNIRWALDHDGLRRRQAWAFLLPGVVLFLSHLLSHLPGASDVELQALGSGLSGALMILAFHRWRLYSILPLAYASIARELHDGLMVLDYDGWVVELNPAAQKIFASAGIAAGSHFDTVQSAFPEMAGGNLDAQHGAWEAQCRNGNKTNYYQVTRTPLSAHSGSVQGRVLLFHDITEERQQQARMIEQEKVLTMLSEQARLGREMHDGPGQVWSFLSMQTQASLTHLAHSNLAQAERCLRRLLDVIDEVHLGLRESISGLKTGPEIVNGLFYAISDQLQWYHEHCDLRTELDMRFSWQPEMLSPLVETHALRIMQEALANIRKSARASQARIIAELTGKYVEVRVEDDGVGFDPAREDGESGHHGLSIMCERAEEAGIELKVNSQPGQGTQIVLLLPLAEDFITDVTAQEIKP